MQVICSQAVIDSQLSTVLAFEIDGPQLYSISPTSGSTQGGGILTLTGLNFEGNPRVTVGGKVATVNTTSSTTLKAIIPAGEQ